MRGNPKTKILIVGAGPCGLATALTLHKRNIPVEIIERDDRPGTHSYALALHPSTVSLLRDWEMLDGLEQSGIPISHLAFCDKTGPKLSLEFDKLEKEKGGLLVVGQDHLEDTLIKPLEAAKVPIRWNHRLAGLKQTENAVEVDLERLMEGMSGYAMARLEWQVDKELSTKADFVVGADGHFSMVRRKLGIEFPKVAKTQSFAVFEFQTDFKHDGKAHVVFGDEGTNILWPLPNGYCRWGFEIDENEAEAYSRDKDRLFVQVGSHGYHVLEGDMLEAMIRERAPWFDGSIERFRWRMIVRFEKRLADSFGRDRVWLAGDAGHLAPPIGMQSMNIGIAEGHDLGNRLADVLEGKADLKSLEDYGRDRETEWRSLLGLDTVVEPKGNTDAFLSEHAAKLQSCLPASGGTLADYAKVLNMNLKIC